LGLAFLVLASASLGARAQKAITISNTAPLVFGKFAAGSGGTVTISPAGARSATGAVVLSSTGAGSAASFILSGTPNKAFTIVTLPANGTVVLTGPGGSMAVNNFISSPAAATGGAFGATGAATLLVGATLTVGPSQAPGAYAGTFSVTVNY
jgi:hypothetical protein